MSDRVNPLLAGDWVPDEDPRINRLYRMIVSNPVGTERIDQSLTMPTPGVQPVAFWGGRPVSQNFRDMVDWGTANALGWAGSTNTPGIRAYHGSPHSFDAFDIGKINTGQGAQMFGRGLYFAEHEPVARDYRDTLTERRDFNTSTGGAVPDWVGNSIVRVQDDPALVRGVINGHLQDFEGRLAEAQAEVKTSHQPWQAQTRIPILQDIVDSLKGLRSGEATLLPRGSMYEVNIKADPAHMLDWDKPLSEQSERVRDRIKGRLDWTTDDMTGAGIYGGLVDRASRDPVAATQQLRDWGIPGIRYLDQGSRSAGEGTSNFVVFDDSLIDILRKYGIAGLMLGGGGAAAGTQGQ